jgi:hypothetical protein
MSDKKTCRKCKKEFHQSGWHDNYCENCKSKMDDEEWRGKEEDDA